MIVFAVIGFVGAGYVIFTGGEANPGYGIVPMLFCIACSSGYRCLNSDKKDPDEEKK